MTDALIFTASAAEKVKGLMKDEQSMVGLRIYIQGGGCSGFNYVFDFAERFEEDDTVVETNNINLLIDPMSLPYLEGATVDFKTDIMGAHFSVTNPNATTTCGCGSSFGV